MGKKKEKSINVCAFGKCISSGGRTAWCTVGGQEKSIPSCWKFAAPLESFLVESFHEFELFRLLTSVVRFRSTKSKLAAAAGEKPPSHVILFRACCVMISFPPESHPLRLFAADFNFTIS